MRMWRNRQTRRIQVPVVVNTLWVQVPSSAPNKKDAFGVFFIYFFNLFVKKEDFFTELNQKIFSDSENEIALFMYNVGITKEPVLCSFENDSGIFERLFSEHLSDQNILALKTVSEEVFLRVLGMHSFGAGVCVAAKQTESGLSPENFSEEEKEKIFSEFDSADAFELALEKLRIPLDSGNRKMLDRVIVIGIKELKLIAKEKTFEPQSLRAFMQVLFNAGISVFLSMNK